MLFLSFWEYDLLQPHQRITYHLIDNIKEQRKVCVQLGYKLKGLKLQDYTQVNGKRETQI